MDIYPLAITHSGVMMPVSVAVWLVSGMKLSVLTLITCRYVHLRPAGLLGHPIDGGVHSLA